MSNNITAGDGSTIHALPSLAAGRPFSAKASLGTIKDRLLRLIGRAVLSLPPSTWLLVDLTLLAFGVYIAYLTFPPPDDLLTPHVALWQALAVFAFALIVASLVFGLYERETFMNRSRTVTRMLLTTAAATILSYAVIYVIMYSTVSRRMTGLALSLFFIGGIGIRFCAWWMTHKLQHGLLVVGSSTLYDSFEEAQTHGLLHEYRLVGYANGGDTTASHIHRPSHLGAIEQQIDRLASLGVTDIVVDDRAARDPNVMAWMVPSLQRGCRVTNEAIFYEKATGQILVDQITPSWFLFADLKVHCDQQASFKRLIDMAVAGLGLCLSAPLWPMIALAIKLCDGGPVFYSQNRVGQNGRVFKLYKFRTMRPNAENGKSVWCSPNDPRVTAVGRFLRKTRLDELPQLYNVLASKMSIVGPRPERPDIAAELCEKIPYYAERHLVKPGITGWAQISFRYGASVEDAKRKLQFDLYYLKHMSFELDMIILFRTAGTFLRGAL